MSKKFYQLSVIVPIFNGENFIKKFFLNIQPIQSDEIEFIFVDDGSSDMSVRILNSYLNFPNCRIFFKNHGGSASARNIGIEKASGKYIVFCDIDDYLDFSCVLKLSLLMDGFNIKLLKNKYIDSSLSNNKFEIKAKLDESFAIANNFQILRDMGFWTYIIRREYLSENNIFFWPTLSQSKSEYFVLDDWFFLLSIVKNQTPVYESNNTVYVYYNVPNSKKHKNFVYQQRRLLYCYFQIFINRDLFRRFISSKTLRYVILDILRSIKYNLIRV